MPAPFKLIITTNHPQHTAKLCLFDAHGSQLAHQLIDFNNIPHFTQCGLFNLQHYLHHYVATDQQAAKVAELGVYIAEQLLGEALFKCLYQTDAARTLCISLPGAGAEQDNLAAALARVPWEMARPTPNQPTLAERNLLVRIVHDDGGQAQPAHTLALDTDEALRVLFVFAEARGSRPLATRQERQALQDLFVNKIYPKRRVVAHFLSHGVTRRRLQAQIQEHGGYHIVHWSGHGNLNWLELAKPGGAQDTLSGEELLALFKKAGGFIPKLFFLSANHSGDLLTVRDLSDVLAAAQNNPPSPQPTQEASLAIPLEERPGYTGTAHALLQGGVPSVVAMRYAVGDDYARHLGVEFYRALLAYQNPQATAAAALAMARLALQDVERYKQTGYSACDHATPVLYGLEQTVPLPSGRSPALDKQAHNRRLPAIPELSLAAHPHFAGRTWELSGLGAEFISADANAVALITGLGGMGKTALAAEALDLWEEHFDWLLLYQAKPNALSLDHTLYDIHQKLNAELGRYHEHVKNHPADAIYRTATVDFKGKERYARLTQNLLRAMGDEAIWLVLDNFEACLRPQPETTAQPDTEETRWACQDAAWDSLLKQLATQLPGTRSRLLLTCRHPLAALAGLPCHTVPLGPLPPEEAVLYLRGHKGFSQMVFGGDINEQALAIRLLNASRFYPLLMDRLARLATGGAALRPQLLAALAALEQQSQAFAELPALFASVPGDTKELAYLEDALAISLDQLLTTASPDARRLLWMLAVANGPITQGLLWRIWNGEEDEKTQQLREIQQSLTTLPPLSPEYQEQLQDLRAEVQAMLDALPPKPDARPNPEPLLCALVAVGLVTEQPNGKGDTNPQLSCHELVRERCRAWMAAHPEEHGNLSENIIRIAYADRLIAAFKAWRHKDMAAALEAGSRGLVYCVQTGDYGRLGEFAGDVVTSCNDIRLLEALLPHLQDAAEAAPEGRLRWQCLGNLANALRQSGCPDASLAFYEQASSLAHNALEAVPADRADTDQAWADVAWISGNWANALMDIGNLDAARQQQLDSANAWEKAGSPAAYIIGSELAALRIDITQGQVELALPQVAARLLQLESWWRQHRSGQPVPEAPDSEYLARAYISALDIISQALAIRQDWQAALPHIEACLEMQRALQRPEEDIAPTQMNRANALARLGRFNEAQTDLEACLESFRHDPARTAKVFSALADLSDKQGDLAQAVSLQRRALTLRETLPNPQDRAISHNNLAIYLLRSGNLSDWNELSSHQLAALIYRLVAGLGQDLQDSRNNYAIHIQRAHTAGTEPTIPRITELLANPAFSALAEWLQLRHVDLADLQAEVDEFLATARQWAMEQNPTCEAS